MSWSERKLTPGFGVELSGLRIGPDLPRANRAAVYEAVVQHGVVVVPGQSLSDDDLFEFADSIGTVNPAPKVTGVPPTRILPLSNVDESGKLLPADDWWMRQNLANELWHLDLTFMRPRATISLLFGRTVPPHGGNTEFCDMRLAYEALPAEDRARLDGLTAYHSIMHSRSTYGFNEWSEEDQRRFPPVPRPLVNRHAENGRKALLLASHISAVGDLGAEETATMMRDLTARATVPQNIYSHRWSAGDLLLWDNRSVMHRATPFDVAHHPRDMRAVRLIDLADA
jgi:alpha-ketoglutarate-dependent 2,4-dichlorophenoxyacetate dioxygenase